jgi:hypothetical protein
MRSTIKIRVQKYRLINKYALQNLPRRLQAKWDKTAKVLQPGSIVANPSEISNEQLLAGVIFRKYGYGTFNVLFFNYWNLNKHYSRRHKCKQKTCKWHNKCTKQYKYKKGQICKDNPKFRPAWSPRIRIIISPADNIQGFNFKTKNSKMYYFRKWFWKG